MKSISATSSSSDAVTDIRRKKVALRKKGVNKSQHCRAPNF